MKNWKLLTETEYEEVWDRFVREFNFRPSIYKKDWPSIKEPKPHITCDISGYYGEGYSDKAYRDLHEKAITAFQSCTRNGELFFALDWQHECYKFDPRLPIDKDPEFNEWLIPVFPNGDYYIFVTIDFQNGFFGHPWEETICIFGQSLIEAFGKSKPIMFNKVVRETVN